MGLMLRLAIAMLAACTLAGHVLAAPPRAYLCTNIMGGNPFRLSIAEDGSYAANSLPQSLQQFDGTGRLELAEIGVYYNVIGGPLAKRLKIDVIHIMSSGLTPSGSQGLFDCKKAK